MISFLGWLGGNGTRVLVASIFVALLVQPLAALARPLLPLAVLTLLTTAMMRVETGELRLIGARPLAPVLGVVWMMVATPLIVGIGLHASGLVAASPAIALSLVLLTTAPPIVSSPALAALLGLNGTLSLILLVTATVLTPLTTPLIAGALTEGALPLGMGQLMLRLGLLIAASLVAAMILRRALGIERIRTNAPAIDGVAVIALMAFAFSIMDGVLARIFAEPLHVLKLAGMALGANLGLLAVATLLFWPAGRHVAATIGFSNGNRNMALVISALGTAVPPDTWLFFVAVQFPIYILPSLLKGAYARLMHPPVRR